MAREYTEAEKKACEIVKVKHTPDSTYRPRTVAEWIQRIDGIADVDASACCNSAEELEEQAEELEEQADASELDDWDEEEAARLEKAACELVRVKHAPDSTYRPRTVAELMQLYRDPAQDPSAAVLSAFVAKIGRHEPGLVQRIQNSISPAATAASELVDVWRKFARSSEEHTEEELVNPPLPRERLMQCVAEFEETLGCTVPPGLIELGLRCSGLGCEEQGLDQAVIYGIPGLDVSACENLVEELEELAEEREEQADDSDLDDSDMEHMEQEIEEKKMECRRVPFANALDYYEFAVLCDPTSDWYGNLMVRTPGMGEWGICDHNVVSFMKTVAKKMNARLLEDWLDLNEIGGIISNCK